MPPDAVMAYSADCPVELGVSVTPPTVMLLAVGEPLTAGCVTVAPSPLAMLIATVGAVGTIAADAPVMLAAGIVSGNVSVAAVSVAAVGVPVMATVTTVALVRVAAAAVNPAGKPVMAKWAAVMVAAYSPPVSV